MALMMRCARIFPDPFSLHWFLQNRAAIVFDRLGVDPNLQCSTALTRTISLQQAWMTRLRSLCHAAGFDSKVDSGCRARQLAQPIVLQEDGERQEDRERWDDGEHFEERRRFEKLDGQSRQIAR